MGFGSRIERTDFMASAKVFFEPQQRHRES
jgi:hypothetical protein